jgi:hypothetical protein
MATTVKQWLTQAAQWARAHKLTVAIAIAVLLGLYGIEDALNIWVAAVVGIVALLIALPFGWMELVTAIPRMLGAVVIAFLALAGFDILINFLLDAIHLIPHAHYTRVPLELGLVLAVLIFAAVASWYLRLLPWGKWIRRGVGLALAVLVILVAPYAYGELTADTDPVPDSKLVPSKLDVRIVSDGRRHTTLPRLPKTPVLSEFAVTYSVGFAADGRVRWTLVESDSQDAALGALSEGDGRAPVTERPAAHEDADPVLLLLVDGTNPVVGEPAKLPDRPARLGEVARWRALAAGAAAPGTPTFALLQTSSRKRIRAWRHFVPDGEAVSVRALESETATDAAVRLAIGAPTAKADFALATAFRPVLLFDHEERVPWPVSVMALFDKGVVYLCHDHGIVKSGCGSDPIRKPSELESGGTHMKLDLKLSYPDELRKLARRELEAQEQRAGEAAARPVVGAPREPIPPSGVVELAAGERQPGTGSAIYVHPVTAGHGRKERLYLDYWWYLPINPVSLGGGALCGAGLVIAGVTCQSHQSDWEGMTVVVDRTGAVPEIVAVQYAQHNKVIRYDWDLLRRYWENKPKVKKLVERIDDASTRPLAFVASGSHATYPDPCPDCSQVADTNVSEEPHNGDRLWVGDITGACGVDSCLQTLPTDHHGQRPALWNAYDGTWGEHHCFLTYYCDSGTPPTAPGHQKRYLDPTHYDGSADLAGTKWRYHPEALEE